MNKVIEQNYNEEVNADYFIVNLEEENFPNLFTVYSNERTEPDKFDANVHCSFCDEEKNKFNSKLVYFEETVGKKTIQSFICKTCLSKMIKAIDTAILYREEE